MTDHNTARYRYKIFQFADDDIFYHEIWIEDEDGWQKIKDHGEPFDSEEAAEAKAQELIDWHAKAVARQNAEWTYVERDVTYFPPEEGCCE